MFLHRRCFYTSIIVKLCVDLIQKVCTPLWPAGHLAILSDNILESRAIALRPTRLVRIRVYYRHEKWTTEFHDFI